MKTIKFTPISLDAFCITAIFFLSVFLSSLVQAASWPQELSGDKGTIIIYQPQPEKLLGNALTGRAAMQLELTGNETPIFGVLWFTSTIETDRSTNSVIINNIKVTNVAWPDSNDNDEESFTQFVEQELQSSSFTASLSKLTATLASAEKVKQSLDNIKNDPPVILFEDQLAVLLTFDGEPIFKEIENSPYQRALNTTFAVIKVKDQPQYYLTSGSLWYQATNELGPWQVTSKPPQDLVKMLAASNASSVPESSSTSNSANHSASNVTKIPAVITATKATELIVTDGKPEWESLVGGKLLFVKNTETPWIRDIANGDMYILLSGRWFSSKKEQGPWSFVRGDKLPQSFQEIPPESTIGGLRVSVAGTDEANQAVLDAQIPQTAAIKRSEAKLTVQYDGEPKFEKIPNTDVEYAVNTGSQVLKIAGKYYAVDNGVWFVANSPQGTWQVADSIPTESIAQIPPSSPMYNTTYVTVYGSTPEIVYVGYTPGYMWSYPYYGVPIYGTGWYYPPYYGGWYYPRPPTWGMHVGYNPWRGWTVGMSWGSPFFRVGVSWGGGYHNHYRPCCGGYYGGGYRGGHNTNININGDINIGNRVGHGRDNKLARNLQPRNIYNKPANRQRNATKATTNRNIKQARPTNNRANNVFADKQGNVVRHHDGQWQNRNNKSWKNVPQQRNNNISTMPQRNNNLSTRPNINNATRANRGGFDHSGMNQARQARSMGGYGGARRGGRR